MYRKLQPEIRGLILDMDGVLWRGNQPIGDLPAIFAHISALGLGVVMASNNATLSIYGYLEKLAHFGVHLQPWQVINSGQAMAFALSKSFPEGGPVYMIGEKGLEEALAERSFYPSTDSDVLAVVAGLDRQITYEKLKKATLLIRRGIPFMGTNPDTTFPSPDGLIPGAGAILAALEASTGQKPFIAGKPEKPMFELALERLGTLPVQTLMVGDRLGTDVVGAQQLGMRTALVLTGVSTMEEAQQLIPGPDLIAPDLSTLLALEISSN